MVAPLKLHDRPLGDHDGTFLGVHNGAHPTVLPRSQEIAGIGEDSRNTNRAGLHVHLPLGKGELPLFGVNATVRQDELQHPLFCLRLRFGLICTALPSQHHVFLFADGKIDLDRVNCGDGGQFPRLGRADQVADLGVGAAGDAVDGRGDLGEAEIQSGLLDVRLGSLNRSLGGKIGLDSVIELLLTDGALLGERPVAFDIQLSLPQFGLGHRQLGNDLVQCRLESPRVDLEQKIAFFYRCTFFVGLPGQIPGNLGTDIGVHQSLGGADPFGKNGHVFLSDGHDLDFRD